MVLLIGLATLGFSDENEITPDDIETISGGIVFLGDATHIQF